MKTRYLFWDDRDDRESASEDNYVFRGNRKGPPKDKLFGEQSKILRGSGLAGDDDSELERAVLLDEDERVNLETPEEREQRKLADRTEREAAKLEVTRRVGRHTMNKQAAASRNSAMTAVLARDRLPPVDEQRRAAGMREAARLRAIYQKEQSEDDREQEEEMDTRMTIVQLLRRNDILVTRLLNGFKKSNPDMYAEVMRDPLTPSSSRKREQEDEAVATVTTPERKHAAPGNDGPARAPMNLTPDSGGGDASKRSRLSIDSMLVGALNYMIDAAMDANMRTPDQIVRHVERQSISSTAFVVKAVQSAIGQSMTVPVSPDGDEAPISQIACEACGSSGGGDGMMQCAACKQVAYCGASCQKTHWNTAHKYECVSGSSTEDDDKRQQPGKKKGAAFEDALVFLDFSDNSMARMNGRKYGNKYKKANDAAPAPVRVTYAGEFKFAGRVQYLQSYDDAHYRRAYDKDNQPTGQWKTYNPETKRWSNSSPSIPVSASGWKVYIK